MTTPEKNEQSAHIDVELLGAEAQRYLDVVAFFRAEGCDPFDGSAGSPAGLVVCDPVVRRAR
jgi:hypothetical protein